MKDYERRCREWALAWGQASPDEFAAQYAEDGIYIDHAFRLARSGRAGIAEHSAIWHSSITGFEMTPREIQPFSAGAFMTWLGSGHFGKDLPAFPATNADFAMHGAVWLKFDTEGLITESEEYYSVTFAESNEHYYPPIPAGGHVVGGEVR